MSGEIKPHFHVVGERGPELVLELKRHGTMRPFDDEHCRLEVEGFNQLWVSRMKYE